MDTMIAAVAVAICGLVLIVTGAEAPDGVSKPKLAGVALTFVVAPAVYACQQLGPANYREIGLAALGIIGGIILIWCMLHLFTTTSPVSQNMGQYLCFGFIKWDDFGELLVVGVLVTIFGFMTLVSATGRAIEYQQAYDSIKKCELEKAKNQKSIKVNAKLTHRNATKSPSHNRKLALR